MYCICYSNTGVLQRIVQRSSVEFKLLVGGQCLACVCIYIY
jgi:hypothetical protein